VKAGITICEDIWCEKPAQALADSGSDIIFNLNASPYHLGKQSQRLATLKERCQQTDLPVIYVNQVGGQDELVFDSAAGYHPAHHSLAGCPDLFGHVPVQRMVGG